MRVYTLKCECCQIDFVYGTNVSRDLAVKGYSTCPSCGAWNAFREPPESRAIHRPLEAGKRANDDG